MEIISYLFLLHLSFLEIKSCKSFSNLPLTSKFRPILTLTALVDAILYLLSTNLLHPPPPLFRFAPYIRIILLSLLPVVSNSFKSSLKIIPAFLDVLALLVGFYLFSGWLMAMLLDDVDSYLPRCAATFPDLMSCPKANDGFASLPSALYTMATVATNADVPDLQLPSYSHSRPMGLVWLAFYVISNFFLLNLVLAQGVRRTRSKGSELHNAMSEANRKSCWDKTIFF